MSHQRLPQGQMAYQDSIRCPPSSRRFGRSEADLKVVFATSQLRPDCHPERAGQRRIFPTRMATNSWK